MTGPTHSCPAKHSVTCWLAIEALKLQVLTSGCCTCGRQAACHACPIKWAVFSLFPLCGAAACNRQAVNFTLVPASCRRFQLTRDALLQVLGHRTLLEDRSTEMLQQKIALRATYVTPCNLIQVGCWLM